jgi:hypothetical protein
VLAVDQLGDFWRTASEPILGARCSLPVCNSAAILQPRGENKYYEANLALKAIEDSVTLDSISFSDLQATPKSAKNAS